MFDRVYVKFVVFQGVGKGGCWRILGDVMLLLVISILCVEGGVVCTVGGRFWAEKWEQTRKFAVWGPSQLQHFGGWSGVLGHSAAEWLPAHFTHLGGCPQFREPWPKRWHEKHWARPVDL